VQEPVSGDRRAGVAAAKAALRASVNDSRRRQPAEQRATAGRLIRDHVLSMPQAEMAGTVAAYFSFGTEPGTHSLIFGMWKRGTYVILPRLRPDGDLDWASYEGPDSLVPGSRGVLEPSEPSRGVAAISRAALVLVPALAVDQAGLRLGRGGGSYDRALARVGERVPVIALLYDGELIGQVPAEPHDRPVSAVALPSRGIVTVRKLLRRWVTISTRIARVPAGSASIARREHHAAGPSCPGGDGRARREHLCPRTSTPAPNAASSSRRCRSSATTR
jgi:5-formyltetrahydrofolate cyclo-ligase